MKNILIKDAYIVNEDMTYKGSIHIQNDRIYKIYTDEALPIGNFDEIIDAKGKYLLPGVIDDQVHFRDPGLTHKADMESESMAAVAGGTTTFMDMPNTIPQTVTEALIREKRDIASQKSVANYAFYIGANNENIDELKKIDNSLVCGVKVFMGSSTGNMLVDKKEILKRIFSELSLVVATHCEKEEVIKANIAKYTSQYGDDLPIEFHSKIRNEEACYASSSEAVELATKYGGRLHLLHLSTARELSLLSDAPLKNKKITGEVCVHHLWFNDTDYPKLGNKIKWNPSIKTENDRIALMNGVKTGKIDVIATDHAPHLWEEKQGSCLKAASGGPIVQYSLLTMLEKVREGEINIEKVVEKMSHAPATLFNIKDRGFIKEGYYADLVIVDPESKQLVDKSNILSKCKWSPLEGFIFNNKIDTTIVNGNIVYRNGVIDPTVKGMAVEFDC